MSSRLPALPPPCVYRHPRMGVTPSRVLITAPTATALSALLPPLIPLRDIALTRCRLHISVVLVARVLRFIGPFAPDLALPVHILAARRAGGARAYAGPRRDFDVLRAAMVGLRVVG
jgi:hypothetical protein